MFQPLLRVNLLPKRHPIVAPLSHPESHGREEPDDDVLSTCSSQFSSASSYVLDRMVKGRKKSLTTTKQDKDRKKEKKEEENAVPPPPRPATAIKSSSFTSTTSHTSVSTTDTTTCSSSNSTFTTPTTPTREDFEFEEELSSSPPTTSDTGRKSKVRFCKTVRAKNHLHSDDYTKQERQASWYSSEEITRIRKQTREIVHFHDNNDTAAAAAAAAVSTFQSDRLDDRNDIRGLERRTRSGNAIRIKNHVAAMRCVLDEQDRQRCMDDYDPDYISLLYRDTISLLCAYEAVQIGKQDEQIAAAEATGAGATAEALV